MKDFKPGFRLSKFDVAVLLLGGSASILLWSSSMVLAAAMMFVIGHFFLFCNVFRFARPPELIWAATFTVLVWLSFQIQLFSIYIVFLLQSILTIILLALEVRKPCYHGVFWQKLNPNLKFWFDSNGS